ncbi:serine protease [Lithospermum erythrorhizon]|uniref:Serine protease n=1 Tax=Lithospermum erythrorhizon TaxID=34254 RepID=A0AAV3NTB0_LITER
MKNLKSSILILLSITICNDFININANDESNVYVAYLGNKPHDDHQRIVESHHDLLAKVVGSKEQASKLMVHNYKYGFSGFSAKLTKSQARKLSAFPGVIHLFADHGVSPHGTRAPDYLGLTAQLPNNIWQRTNQGDGVIIGVIDTGVWANSSKAFSDEGYGPIPYRWKGTCKSEGDFNAAQHCNNKVIGAYWFRKGAMAAKGFAPNDVVEKDSASPLDMNGHGSHCASTAAGSEVRNVTYMGHQMGTFRGAAPKARLAIYKACYNIRGNANPNDDCLVSDVIEAFDQAIHDGVDVISASIGPRDSQGDIDNYLNFASYHAVANGITVVAAAGNMGPEPKLGNTSPWHITVAATKLDEDLQVPITLGNTNIVMGSPISGNDAIGLKKVVTFDNSIISNGRIQSNNNDIVQKLKGNVAFFPDFAKFTSDLQAVITLYQSIKKLGGAGLIVEMNPAIQLVYDFGGPQEQIVFVEKEVARQIDAYLRVNADGMVNLGKPKIVQGRSIRSMVDSYSSRGPSKHTPMIIKPDIAAPGTNLIAAVTPYSSGPPPVENGFQTMSGTSQATPIVAGLVALLKSEHPFWSPAAIKSALVTTGSNTDPYGAPILSPWSPNGIAGPFDFGGGVANVNAASDPGLVYDMQPTDYFNYLCGVGYSINDIKSITRDQNAICPPKKQSLMDVNLPSIGISGLQNSVTIKRTVTNVGNNARAFYVPQFNAPKGTRIFVTPTVLDFNPFYNQITYEMTIEKIGNVDKNAVGSLTWTDGIHRVTSPIVVLS